MPGSNNCSGNCNSGSMRHPCRVPVNSANLCSSNNMSCANVYCLPGACQDGTWLPDNRQENFGDAMSCQPVLNEPSAWENSCCPSAAFYMPRPCQGPSFIPTASFVPSSCFPVGYRPVSYMPGGCRPQGIVMYGCGPGSFLPCGPQALSIMPGGLRPVRPLSGGCLPVTGMFGACRPSCSAMGSQ